MKAVLYARVSSEKQAEKDLSISAQLKALRQYADNHEFEVVREFVDEAESARTANRPKFQEMFAWAKQKNKPFDIILVWKFSRFARNREDSVVIKSLLRKRGIEVISINEQTDDSPTGRLLEAIIESMDEFYSANLGQEVRRGLREVASRGFYPGGSTPIGYKLVNAIDGRAKRRTLTVDNEFAPVIQRIFELCIDGSGTKEIARILNEDGVRTKHGAPWTKATVRYVLRNPVYTGVLVWPHEENLRPGEEQIVIENHHESIASQDDFDRAQVIMTDRSPHKTHPKRVASNYLLSGLIYCEKCGKAMLGGTAKSGKYRYYGCYSRARVNSQVCDCKAINTDRIESTIVEKLQSHILTDENLAKLFELTNSELAAYNSGAEKQLRTLRTQLTARERKLDRLYDVLEEGNLSSADLAPRIRKLKADADQLRSRIAELEMNRNASAQQVRISKPRLRRYVEDLRQTLLEGEYFEQRAFLRSFIQRIDYNYSQVTIQYIFPVNQKSGGCGEVLAIGKLSGLCETNSATG